MAHIMIMHEMHKKAQKRERVFRDRSNPLDFYTDDEIRSRFRFTRTGIFQLLDYLGDDLKPALRYYSYHPTAQLLAALRFYATGTFQLAVGDTFIEKVSQSMMSRFIHSITDSLVKRVPDIIRFPNTEPERAQISAGFFAKCGIPNTLGSIDCTHVKIVPTAKFKPGPEFYGRKGCTINSQFVCDDKGRFIDAVVKHPGSAHDMRIFKESTIGQQFTIFVSIFAYIFTLN